MTESTAVTVEAVMPAVVETTSSTVSARSSLLDVHSTSKAALPPVNAEDHEDEDDEEEEEEEQEEFGQAEEEQADAKTITTRADSSISEHVPASPHIATSTAEASTSITVEETNASPRSITPESPVSDADNTPSTPVVESTTQPVFVTTTTLHDPSLDHLSSPETPTATSVPTPAAADDGHKSTDSLVSVALSQSSIPDEHLATEEADDAMATPRVQGARRHLRRVSSLDILQNKWPSAEGPGPKTLFDTSSESPLMPMSAMELQREDWTRGSSDLEAEDESTLKQRRRETTSTLDTIDMLEPGLDTPALTASRSSIDTTNRTSGSSSEDGLNSEVDWSVLDKTEEQEKEDKSIPEGAEDESTAFLLARLEQENAKFALDPKATSSKGRPFARARAASRPPSMAHLKKLVAERDAPSIRYSMASDVGLPAELPPMTELEFWAALVQDYPSTAVRLPTLTTTKIRSGIPPPLRGVVWSSMAGARDRDLEDAFEKLVNEKSPYEGIINKDVGRSFPGVELFRDAEGEGQKMLGRVLKCFSLQDKDIGYCQGLGFLVGPLLMNMGEREAFCVLVRLMDHYSLRPSFLPSLSGLHMRIYQFSALLRQHHTKLHNHLADLGIEPAYLSQWFLSCFAVTCPLPMLFRIYDVIFAEGANETVMRVALALMRRHEEKMLATTEFEEVMQLLLGRELWDCYGGDADELVDDFTSLGEIVTFARLAELEKEFDNKSSEAVGQSAGFLPDVQAAAGRFLGRLWAPGHATTPSKAAVVHAASPSVTTLSPPSAEKDAAPTGGMGIFGRPTNFLRRSPSKQSITLATESTGSEDSTSTAGSGAASLASTAPTELDAQAPEGNRALRESMADSMSMRSKAESIMPSHAREQQELHAQIEDLLVAIGEMQREHSQLAAMLQREREDRSEDHRTMRQIVGKLRKGDREDRRRTFPVPPRERDELKVEPKGRPLSVGDRKEVDIVQQPEKPKDDMDDLVEKMQERLQINVRFSSSLETKAHLRTTLARTREQLAGAEAQAMELTASLENAEAAVSTFQSESEDLRAEVKELRLRVADEYKARQKLEHQVQELKAQARSVDRKERLVRESMSEAPAASRPDSRKTNAGSAGGLRELKLGRRESGSSVQSLRASRSPPLLQTDMSMSYSRFADNGSPEGTPQSTSPYRSNPDIIATPPSAVDPPSAGGMSKERRGFSKRTSSLATQEVFATPQHESVPEEALLLELVNAKTSEAQARQEVDELRKALSVGRRKQDEALSNLRAEMDASKAEAAKAWQAAQVARAEAEAARTGSIFSLPPTPYSEETHGGSGRSTAVSTPGEEKSNGISVPKKTEAPSSTVGGWFWGRRTASQSVNPPPAVKEGE